MTAQNGLLDLGNRLGHFDSSRAGFCAVKRRAAAPDAFFIVQDFEANIRGFVAGVNTLEFDVNNAGDATNPVGLRVEDLEGFGNFGGIPDFRITSITRPSGNPLTLTLTWASIPGAKYRVEFSQDLASWSELADIVDSQGDSTTLDDSFALNLGGRVFYRVVQLP